MEKNNPVPMLVVTPAFDVIEANAAYLAMSGIPESEILKTNIHGLTITGRSGKVPGSPLRINGVLSGNLPLRSPRVYIPLSRYLYPGA